MMGAPFPAAKKDFLLQGIMGNRVFSVCQVRQAVSHLTLVLPQQLLRLEHSCTQLGHGRNS